MPDMRGPRVRRVADQQIVADVAIGDWLPPVAYPYEAVPADPEASKRR